MKWIEAKIIFDFQDRQLAVDLISNLFYEAGLRGVVIEDPEIVPGEDWAQDAPNLPQQNAVIGYFPENAISSKQLEIIKDNLHRLEKELGIASRIFYSRIDEADWAESWKSHFWPAKIGAGIVVKPTWREYIGAENETVLEIDPGMAFGTGTHPTTALCIELLETYLKRGDSFLDVGTGSGILMVAAAKLGAAKVRGIDNDDQAVEIARQNMLQNRIATKAFKVTAGNLVDGVDEPYNLVAANISSDTVLKLLDSIGGVLAANGMFICSGIVAESKNNIVTKIQAQGFEVIEVRTKEGWAAIAARLVPEFCMKIDENLYVT